MRHVCLDHRARHRVAFPASPSEAPRFAGGLCFGHTVDTWRVIWVFSTPRDTMGSKGVERHELQRCSSKRDKAQRSELYQFIKNYVQKGGE